MLVNSLQFPCLDLRNEPEFISEKTGRHENTVLNPHEYAFTVCCSNAYFFCLHVPCRSLRTGSM